MKVLVTGANGFVGGALFALLKQQVGLLVTGSVRTDTGAESGLLAVGDINAATDWSAALIGVDVVVHCAARVHIMHDKAADPLAAFRQVNVDGSLQLARQAMAAGVKRFIFLSSIKVNGESTQPGHPFSADDEAAPQDDYGRSKFEAEQALRALMAGSPMELVIIRPPLVYGPGVRANFLSMLNWVYCGIPLPLGAIRQLRSLVALDNLLDLIVCCLAHPAAANEVFLVSDGEDVSLPGLLRKIAQALGVKARLLPVPESLLALMLTMLGKHKMRERLCCSLQVDISKTRRLLAWSPPFSSQAALDRLASSYLSDMAGKKSAHQSA